MLRLFIALPLPGDVARQLEVILNDLRPQSRDVKWVPVKNIHLTVKFLGDSEEKLVPKITAEIDRIAAEFAPFDSMIDRIGAFPNLRRPRVIWVGGEDEMEQAAKMARQVDLAMRQLRYPKENRPFRAHLTLGRVRQGRRVDQLATYLEQYRVSPVPLHLDRLVLFESTLTPRERSTNGCTKV